MPTFDQARDGFVYFIQPEGGGLIKIGWAKDPDARRTLLQCGSPVKLKLCRAQPGAMEDEKSLHRIFAELREHGEWFRAHPALARVADAIPDPKIEDGAITPPTDLSWEVKHRRWRDEAWRRWGVHPEDDAQVA